MPVIIEFSRCIGTYSGAKFELYYCSKRDVVMNRKQKIYNLLLEATEKSFVELFERHKEEYYYCALVMVEDATPCIVAMSYEALELILNDMYDNEKDKDDNRSKYKWSYADSPYFGYCYEKYFKDVDEAFYTDIWSTNISDNEYSNRIDEWMKIMGEVMEALKEKGIFHTYCPANVFINAELQPPETDINVQNAKYLNSNTVFNIWYEENKEETEENDIDWNEVWNPKMCRVVLVEKLIDKKIAAKIRKDFLSKISLNEFIKLCNCPPFIINDKFLYKTALDLIEKNMEYLKFIKVELTN